MNPVTLYGITTVNEKGQVVIPADARHERDFTPGTRVAVVALPHGFEGLMLIKAEEVEKVMSHLKQVKAAHGHEASLKEEQ